MPAIQNTVEVEVARLPQHDVDDDEGSEALGLMTSEAVDRSRDEFDDEFYDSRVWSGSFRTLVLPMIVVLVIATLAVLLPGIGSASDTFESLRTPARIPVEYKCPSQVGLADNYDADFNKDYEDAATAITDNMTEFLETFRSKNFDTWGHSYDEVKEGMFHFKSTYYPPYLNDGDSIYESACGIGLNLFMTLEILQEAKGIENLFVYGNELVEVSANKANVVLDHVPAHGHKGVICTGDSADLQYIPENSFDLVYTGYISPLFDPLRFRLGSEENYKFYTNICKADEGDWKANKLNEIQQQAQDDWYGRWVAEMSRIAKPGVPVIVEQVSPRYCDAFFDWGGVNRQFWYDAARNDTYGWNVDPDSIIIEDDNIFEERYHVFMLKR